MINFHFQKLPMSSNQFFAVCIKCGSHNILSLDSNMPPETKLYKFICFNCYRSTRDQLYESEYLDKYGNLIATDI